MKKEIKKVPTIRFKGVTDDWEQCKLGEIVNKAVDNRGKTPPISDEGTHPLIEVACLGNGFPDYSKIKKYLDDITFKSMLREYIKKDDILFSTVGSIGLVSLMDSHENAAIAQNIVAFRAKENYDSHFLYAMFSTKGNQNKAMRIVMGAVQPSIKVSQLINVEYYITHNIKEEELLGSFFLHIDHLITLHQRKLDQLQTLKKYFLQNMFPAKGEKVPAIRFKGFTGDWEQRKLGDIADSYSGGTPSAGNEAYYGGNIPFIRSAEINSESTELFLTKAGLNHSSAKMVSKGNILYALYGATSGEVGIARVDGAINQAILAILPHEEYNAQFIMQWLKKSKNSIISMYLQGGQGNLSATIVKNLSIHIPAYVEQVRIGEYFADLDNLITLHQRKIDQLQSLKKFMLQNLFI